jgi:MFS family permease
MRTPCISLLQIAAGFTLYTITSGLFNLLPWAGKPTAAIYALSIAFTGPVLVVLSAAVQREKLLAICLFLLSACNAVAGIGSNPTVQLFSRVAAALLHPVLFPAAFAVSVKAVPESHKPHAVGSAIAGIFLGVTVCLFTLQVGASHLAHPSLLLICATWHAVVACFFYRQKEEKCRKNTSSYLAPTILLTSSPCKARSLSD